MDPVGLGMAEDATAPNFACKTFIYRKTGAAFSVIWPITNVDTNTRVSRELWSTSIRAAWLGEP